MRKKPIFFLFFASLLLASLSLFSYFRTKGDEIFFRKIFFQKSLDIPLGNSNSRFLESLIPFYPDSSSSNHLKKVLADLRFNDFLSPDSIHFPKTKYLVQRGDSLQRIAAQHKMNLALLIYLNGKESNLSVYFGEKILIFSPRVEIFVDAKKKEISLWNQGKFLKAFPFFIFEKYKVPEDAKTFVERVVFSSSYSEIAFIRLKNQIQMMSLEKKRNSFAGAILFLEEKDWKNLSILLINGVRISFI